MNVLLLSMPGYFEHMRPVAIRMPNGALTSLAATVDPHLRVAVAELILSHRQVGETVTRLVRKFDPAARVIQLMHEVMEEDSGQSVLSLLETHILPLVPGL